VEQLDAGYLDITVVRDVTFSVAAGEVMTILGANGAGKSTTLLALSGLAERHGGTVRCADQDLDKVRPAAIARLGIGHVPEDRSLFTRLTVAENLRLGGRGSTRHRERVDTLFPPLAKLADRQVGRLSGGEQQMVALARALMSGPRLLLVDELSLGLAPFVVKDLLRTLRRIADDDGVGVVLVEQHVQLAASIADRMMVLSHGRVTMSGPASDLTTRADELRAAYLGTAADPAA
jgi:branched-chain amino acid transport system ATP-binding protein